MSEIILAKEILRGRQDLSITDISVATNSTAKEVINLIVHGKGAELAREVISVYGEKISA